MGGSSVEILNAGVIRINRVDGSEAGDYKCTATNDGGTATAMANLVVQERPSITFNSRTGSMVVNAGEELRIVCTASGDPTPMVSWERLQGYMPRQNPTPNAATYIEPRARKAECMACSFGKSVQQYCQSNP